MNYKINLEAAWAVKNIKKKEDAFSIALAEAGKRLNPELDYVDINIKKIKCEACKKDIDSILIAADTALVGLSLDIKIYDAKSEEHASRISKSVIGKAFKDIPLKVINISQF